jgi:hypothetical protein
MRNHRRVFAAALVLVFVAGLIGIAAAKGKAEGKAPKLLIANKTAQMGEVLEGQDITYTFTIKNIGDGEAQILSVRPG